MSPTSTRSRVPASAASQAGDRGLLAIGVFELVKTVLFLVAAAGVFRLIHRDTQLELLKLLHAFRISGEGEFVKSLLLKANLITDPRKRVLAGILLLYAALHAAEGIGILLRKRWAEYFTVIMTALWIPLEVYTVVHHLTHATPAGMPTTGSLMPPIFGRHVLALEVAGLFANVAIVWFLLHHLKRSRRETS